MIRATLIGALGAMIGFPVLGQQSAALKSCPLMSLADAAVIVGPKVEFYSGREGSSPGASRSIFCTFGEGEGRSLIVKAGSSLAKSVAEYRNMFEPLRKMSGQTLEQGLGEYAYSKLEGGRASMSAVTGTLVVSVELDGKDVGPADMDKLRAALQKALGKL